MAPIFSQMPQLELQQYSSAPQTFFPHVFVAGTHEHERDDQTSPWTHICVWTQPFFRAASPVPLSVLVGSVETAQPERTTTPTAKIH